MKYLVLSFMFINFSLNASDTVTKKFFVKGMDCVGCISNVKKAFKKENKLTFIKQKLRVGKAELTFEKSSYIKGKTECLVANTVEKATEYFVFLDKEHKVPACKS